MMPLHSLSTRLMLAFALTSLVGISLAALFVRQFVVSEFDSYLLTQRRDALVTELQAYYGMYGSWEGVSNAVSVSQPQPEAASNQPREQDGEHAPQEGFLLSDMSGTVVLAPDAGMLGEAARAEELVGSTPVSVNGVIVGTLVTLGPPEGATRLRSATSPELIWPSA